MKSKERIKLTGEVFTPMELCFQMIHEIPEEKLIDPTSTYLDNSCGDGNFLVALLQVLTEEYGYDRDQALSRLYGVDLMPDNIARVRERLNIEPGSPHWDHFVCHDALTYDYSFGRLWENLAL